MAINLTDNEVSIILKQFFENINYDIKNLASTPLTVDTTDKKSLQVFKILLNIGSISAIIVLSENPKSKFIDPHTSHKFTAKNVEPDPNLGQNVV